MKKVIQLGVFFTLALFLALPISVAAQKGFVASASLASASVNFDEDTILTESGFGLQPYIDVALTGSAFASDEDGIETTISGVGFSGGGGVHWFVGRNVALNLGIIMSRVNYDKVESEGVSVDGLDFKAWNSRIKAGVAIYL